MLGGPIIDSLIKGASIYSGVLIWCFVARNMDGREWNGNAIGIKGEFDFFEQGKFHLPVLLGFYPGAYKKIHAIDCQLAYCNQGCWLGQYAQLLFEDGRNNIACGADIVLIADAENHIDTAGGAFGVIDDIAAVNRTVRNNDFFVVASVEGG